MNLCEPHSPDDVSDPPVACSLVDSMLSSPQGSRHVFLIGPCHVMNLLEGEINSAVQHIYRLIVHTRVIRVG